jgi:hypothetical protein
MAWYEANKADFVPKNMNPPNCPKFRPIERYWANITRKMKKTGTVVKKDKDIAVRVITAATGATRALVRSFFPVLKFHL